MEASAKSKYKFQLEKSQKPKGDCPQCKAIKSFRHYEGLSREYGICDRKNNCGYENKPNKENVSYTETFAHTEAPAKTIYPGNQFCNSTIKNQSSLFHNFCINEIGISSEHLKKWNCGTIEDRTVFVYKNKAQLFLNMVHIEYTNNGKRNKEKVPYSLSSKENEKYSLCLFGEHLLRNDTIVCLVESEKTAVIASFFYPQYDWLATGGANKLTDEKISVLFGKEIYYLSDADKAGLENSSIKKLIAYKQNFKIIKLFPDKTDGYDIADALIDGNKPEIKPTDVISSDDANKIETVKSKNISVFEIVEKYLSDRYDIRLNIVSNEIEFKKKNDNTPFEKLNDNNIYIELQKEHISFSHSKLKNLLASDYVKKYDPFLDYFESLPEYKDAEGDFISKVSDYLPIIEDDKKRFVTQFKKMLVRSIACALLDGVFNKQAFILVHDQQNSGKSTFCRWLCPPTLSSYITENLTTDKDGIISLGDNFLINLDELATLNRAEINNLKAMMSKDVIKIRRPYGTTPVLTPRRASFIGSTNKSEFLSDETGSVRWICFELIGRINFNYKNDINIDDVWRQAYKLFKDGFKYQLTPEEIEENDKANKTYQITTEEYELVQKNYLPGSKDKHDVFYQATDITNALSEKYPHTRINRINIGKALKMLGFKQEQKMKEDLGFQIKGYYIKFSN